MRLLQGVARAGVRNAARILLHRLFADAIARRLNAREAMTFSWHGVDLPYRFHAFNTTWLHERSVELALAEHHLQRAPSMDGVLEVGRIAALRMDATSRARSLRTGPRDHQR